MFTGRRVNEVLQLKHEHVNYKNNTFVIPAETLKIKKNILLNFYLFYKRQFRKAKKQQLEEFLIWVEIIQFIILKSV